jgi:wyosine [tRNA(Phe)-imidazoG37] synthetase (radical SAM superfamily)
MNKETKLRIHNITAKAALKFGSEAWVLKKREEQCLEAAKMKFLRHLHEKKKLDKEKDQKKKKKTGAQNVVKDRKQYLKKCTHFIMQIISEY